MKKYVNNDAEFDTKLIDIYIEIFPTWYKVEQSVFNAIHAAIKYSNNLSMNTYVLKLSYIKKNHSLPVM